MHNIRSNVTRRASPGTGSHVIGSSLGVLSWTSGSYNPIIFYEVALSLVICLFYFIFMGSAFNTYISCKGLLLSDMFEMLWYCVVLQVVYHVRVLTVVFLPTNLRVKWMKWYIWSPKTPNRRSIGSLNLRSTLFINSVSSVLHIFHLLGVLWTELHKLHLGSLS